MSNLTLPTMTYQAIDAGLTLKGDWQHELAYATAAKRMGDGPTRRIDILHHGNRIATLWPNGDVRVTNAGYETSTTQNRISIILNASPTTRKVQVNIRNRRAVWSIRGTNVFHPFSSLTILSDGTILDPSRGV